MNRKNCFILNREFRKKSGSKLSRLVYSNSTVTVLFSQLLQPPLSKKPPKKTGPVKVFLIICIQYLAFSSLRLSSSREKNESQKNYYKIRKNPRSSFLHSSPHTPLFIPLFFVSASSSSFFLFFFFLPSHFLSPFSSIPITLIPALPLYILTVLYNQSVNNRPPSGYPQIIRSYKSKVLNIFTTKNPPKNRCFKTRYTYTHNRA